MPLQMGGLVRPASDAAQSSSELEGHDKTSKTSVNVQTHTGFCQALFRGMILVSQMIILLWRILQSSPARPQIAPRSPLDIHYLQATITLTGNRSC
jgi:hypothetical protein